MSEKILYTIGKNLKSVSWLLNRYPALQDIIKSQEKKIIK